MAEKQRTIARSISVEGFGIHTGNECKITFHPAEENYGFKFDRSDITNRIEIPALVDYVVDLSRGTTLGIDGVKVHTVEHVLAALSGLKIDNCRIELSSNEPPILDGSSKYFVEALISAGFVEQTAEREYFIIDETIRYINDAKQVDLVALPTDDYRLTVMIDYFNPALGSQHTGLFNMEKEFVTEFSSARTFCFLKEIEDLFSQGLIKGGTLDNAIVIIDKELDEAEIEEVKLMFNVDQLPAPHDNGIWSSTPLRFKNEPARHKLLDLMGDLTLAGVNLKAQILAARPGHASNVEFAKKIRSAYLAKKGNGTKVPSANANTVMDIYELMKVMPHRYPFLLVDKVIESDKINRKLVAVKNVTINEPYFNGHFPDKPVMPGVLITEAMAQAGALLILQENLDLSNKLMLFLGIRNAKFRKPVIPGDQLILTSKLIGRKLNNYFIAVTAHVNGALVAEAEVSTVLVSRDLK
ncbi:MAG: bifunctional UDP-3-O-[3-hydroxymyristoyl] N-acetylglucosamine deacetylase/3-hydroxyacyl-ACP dehydratase [Candidatus Kapabacteria bacterium]|nr:bifunctional UDP-3-O-[3-hydroxymyristoyl] N-acetylglucosamine deacetylase/3-hydroxyacyl-ACP dehydratase [Candidatus Kapabacteria bacterium]